MTTVLALDRRRWGFSFWLDFPGCSGTKSGTHHVATKQDYCTTLHIHRLSGPDGDVKIQAASWRYQNFTMGIKGESKQCWGGGASHSFFTQEDWGSTILLTLRAQQVLHNSQHAAGTHGPQWTSHSWASCRQIAIPFSTCQFQQGSHSVLQANLVRCTLWHQAKGSWQSVPQGDGGGWCQEVPSSFFTSVLQALNKLSLPESQNAVWGGIVHLRLNTALFWHISRCLLACNGRSLRSVVVGATLIKLQQGIWEENHGRQVFRGKELNPWLFHQIPYW